MGARKEKGMNRDQNRNKDVDNLYGGRASKQQRDINRKKKKKVIVCKRTRGEKAQANPEITGMGSLGLREEGKPLPVARRSVIGKKKVTGLRKGGGGTRCRNKNQAMQEKRLVQ